MPAAAQPSPASVGVSLGLGQHLTQQLDLALQASVGRGGWVVQGWSVAVLGTGRPTGRGLGRGTHGAARPDQWHSGPGRLWARSCARCGWR